MGKKEEKKPLSSGAYDTVVPFAEKIKFEVDKPVVVSFAENFTGPKEMPNKDDEGVFYIFDCISEAKEMCIQTSSITLLRSLKGQEPLANKTLIITKKNVAGKNFFYVENGNAKEKS